MRNHRRVITGPVQWDVDAYYWVWTTLEEIHPGTIHRYHDSESGFRDHDGWTRVT